MSPPSLRLGMDTFRSTYSLFYNKIVTFVDELKTKLKDDAPQELQYITLIPAILPLDDLAFTTYDEDSVVQKALLVTEVTKFVLEKIGQYVVDSEKSWFENQAAELQVYMSIVFSGLVNLRISDDQTPIQDLPTGIGGINAGLAYYDATDLQPLQDMINVLDQGT